MTSMYALLFTIVFQGLVVLSALCVIGAVLTFIPLWSALCSQLLMKVLSAALSVVGVLTPSVVPQAMHLLIAAVWLLLLRVGIYLVAGAYGLLPAVTS